MRKKVITMVMLMCFAGSSIYGGAWLGNVIMRIIYIGAAVAISSATVSTIGVTLSVGSTMRKNKESKEVVMRYMKENHAALVRDIAIGQGPMVTEWGKGFDLTPAEMKTVEAKFEGSLDQLNMMHSLKDEITLEDAEVFSKSLVSLMVKVIGEERIVKLVSKE